MTSVTSSMSEAGGRLHATARPARGRSAAGARAFTLVELITVMAILAVLMTLMVGAYQGIAAHGAKVATKEMLAALNTALRTFYGDFGYYPWPPPGSGEYMGDDVFQGMDLVRDAPYAEEEALYAALTARVRQGPYFRGGGAKTVLLGEGTNRFLVFGDGWGRPIQYKPPKTGSTLPFLYSYGLNGEDDGGKNNGEDKDDISNYVD